MDEPPKREALFITGIFRIEYWCLFPEKIQKAVFGKMSNAKGRGPFNGYPTLHSGQIRTSNGLCDRCRCPFQP